MRKGNWALVLCRCALPCILLGAALSEQPADFESLLASAQRAQARGDFEAAAGFYQQASTLHPDIAELKANLGLMYYQTNKNEQAAAAFQQAIRLNAELFVPNLFLGLDYVKLKRFSEAIPYLKQAARSKPEDSHVLIGLGQAYAGLGETRLAIQSYRKAIRIEPTDADVWYRLGVGYLEQVESDARILLARYKDSGYVQALIAENFADQRVFNQAGASYQKALSLPAFPPGTHAGYGFVLLNEHDLPAAERELKSELASSPGSLFAKLGMARLEVEQGSAEKAAGQIAQIWKADSGFLISNVQRFETGLAKAKITELHPALEKLAASGELPEETASLFRIEAADTPESLGPISELTASNGATGPRLTSAELYNEGKYRRCSDQLAERFPSLSARDLHLLTLCAYATGDYEHAFDAAEKLSASAATGAERLYWETKSSQNLASEALAHASKIDANSPNLLVLLGDVYRQQERFEDAEREYRKGLTLRPQDTGALFGLSLTLLGNGQVDEALHVAQSAIKDNPGDPELNAVMGEVLCRREEFSDAETYLKKSLNTKPEYIPRVHALLSKVYANTNRTQEAITELKLALPEDKDGSLNYQIGRLYLKVGDRDSAQRAFVESKRLESKDLSRGATHPGQGEGGNDSQ